MTARYIAMLCLLLGLIALPGAAGCRRIKNPEAEKEKRPSWIISNYRIKAPQDPLDKAKRTAKKGTERPMQVMIPPNLIPISVLHDFTKATGTEFEISYVDTPETIPERLASGASADLIIGPGHVIQRLIAEGRLKPLNHQHLRNLRNVESIYATNVFDPALRYSVPYFWSYAGIAYNRNYLDRAPRRWRDLLAPKPELRDLLDHKISLLPGPQRAMAAALIDTGSNPNTTNAGDVRLAGQTLLVNATNWHYRFLSKELRKALASGEVLIGQCYSSDAALVDQLNSHVDFALPEDGTWLTIDSFAIPSTIETGKQVMVERFLSFLLQPQVAGRIVNYSLRASTVAGARAFVNASKRLGPTYVHPDREHPFFYQFYDQALYPLREEIWQSLLKAVEDPRQAQGSQLETRIAK